MHKKNVRKRKKKKKKKEFISSLKFRILKLNKITQISEKVRG